MFYNQVLGQFAPDYIIFLPLYDSGCDRSLRKLIEDNKLVFSPLHLFILESRPIDYDIVFLTRVFFYKTGLENFLLENEQRTFIKI